MNFGLSTANISAHSSAGMFSWIVRGSNGRKASSTISCAKRHSLKAPDVGAWTKSEPRYSSVRRRSSSILESIKIFIAYSVATALLNRDFWYRDDKPAAPLAHITQLLHDFVFQIPGQNHYVIGLGFANPVGSVDRNTSPRQMPALLVRTSIDRVFDQIFANAAVMQQRGALSRRTIPCNSFAVLGCLQEKINQRKLRVFHLPSKTFIAGDLAEFGVDFIGNHLLDAGTHGMSLTIRAAGKHAQRPAVRFQFFHIEHAQIMRLHDFDRADQREIGKVFVINRVEFIELDQA